MLGKILHFKFPQSYYMGGDANTLNWAINSKQRTVGMGFLKRGFSLPISVIPVRRLIFYQSYIVYVQISERQRNDVFSLYYESVPAPGVHSIFALNRILHFGLRNVEFLATFGHQPGRKYAVLALSFHSVDEKCFLCTLK